jgi:hypothetical protein
MRRAIAEAAAGTSSISSSSSSSVFSGHYRHREKRSIGTWKPMTEDREVLHRHDIRIIKLRCSHGDGSRVFFLEVAGNCTVLEVKQRLCKLPQFISSDISRVVLVFQGASSDSCVNFASLFHPQAHCCATTFQSPTQSARGLNRRFSQLRWFFQATAVFRSHLHVLVALPMRKHCLPRHIVTEWPLHRVCELNATPTRAKSLFRDPTWTSLSMYWQCLP